MIYTFEISPVDKKINESLLIDEINKAYPTYYITEGEREGGILYLTTSEILDSVEEANIQTLVNAHNADDWVDYILNPPTSTGSEPSPDVPYVLGDDPRLSPTSLSDGGLVVDENGNGVFLGHLKFKFYNQEIVPTLNDGEAAWWHKTSVDETYLVIKVPGMGQKLVELK